ncbi:MULTISPECIES: GNAT family N-acetyltransferase [unclassified Nonomuraea]|uniref:GNAT family N-acetyltransferase n=1 Tax=unclassified Nonomuraea TaxID=2593643 RepID=UPI0034092A6E
MRIRKYRPGDEPALYEVCLRTGLDGQDASAVYPTPHLLADVYVGPYLALQPSLAWVLDDDPGHGPGGPGGYVLGALDTRAFEADCERLWWPALRARYRHITEPERWLADHLAAPRPAPAEIVAGHPSHLHIDLLPRMQGAGWGSRLIATLLQALDERGSRGVHLGVSARNTRAVAFYAKLGFTELEREDSVVFMGMTAAEWRIRL